MKNLKTKVPVHVRILMQRLGITLLLLYITRIIFLAFNSSSFHELNIWDFVVSIWFDMITIGLFFIPMYTLFLLPIPVRGYKLHRFFFKLFWHIINALLIALNLLDVEYFKYTSKRSTFDLFSMLSTGSDLKQLLTTFIKDFWFLILIFIILTFFAEWLYRKTQIQLETFKTKSQHFYKKNIIWLIAFLPILIIIGRGGFALKPTGIIEASNYCKPENTPFVLTTAFTMIKTIDQGGLEKQEFFTESELTSAFNPIKTSKALNILPEGTNVMIIMLESFGIEFIGTYNNGKGYTPFLDSLIDQSLSFNYAFANGKKSIEAVPAVLASMPTLMENPYISSPYGNNKINTLPNILQKHGYSSAFFHGATNGSMRFDGFSKICGFDNYYGRYEYNNDEHFDKTWGILDEYFNPWTASKLTELKEPFFGFLFTLSSHHPYFIPEHMKDKVKKGPQKICASINYGDYALSEFFREAKNQPWYDNTLFVVLADHTPASITPEFKRRTHLYRIPILFYDPSGRIKPERSNKIIQQLDLLPTILDLLNIEIKYYAFGNSHYQTPIPEALAYLSGSYYYYQNNKMTTFTDKKARNLHDFTVQGVAPIDSISHYSDEVEQVERRIKSIIQTYSRDLILNQTTVDEKEDTLYN
ncbi:MAG: sulfatase-like hydrolase/transferase [Crocinitomicaceae bacterium]|nr:sulfatase-like hydrolase/transferase [Crocinitomicaceae bacterium]